MNALITEEKKKNETIHAECKTIRGGWGAGGKIRDMGEKLLVEDDQNEVKKIVCKCQSDRGQRY